ncbi:uncharacterized protein LOC131874259 [Cryptomeria japonica]|uniref:uncharacterized protein LOC131874259 n=1 Tax=Cryptomeria japonica TaxID=3369 RepID=UPI0027D9E2FB|nr:uncharacterized protein LOC131874259 [Cryptomeria japonica]
MANLLQFVDGLDMINNGWIKSFGQIKFAKNSNLVQKVNCTETKKKKIEQDHSMQVVDSRREIQSIADCILEEQTEITQCSNLSKCPYKKKEDNNVKDVTDKSKRFYKSRRRNFQKKKVLYSIDSDVSDDESESDEKYSEDEKKTSVFMVQEILNEKHSGDQSENIDDSEEEDADVVVDLEEELVCALEELEKVRKEYKKYKKSLIKEHDLLNKNIEESNINIAALTTQLDEAKRMYEVSKSDLENKEK